MASQCEEGQVDEVGVYSHCQEQHRQLQQRVQTQKHGTGNHGDHTAQHKDLKKQWQKKVLQTFKLKKLFLVMKRQRWTNKKNSKTPQITCPYFGVCAEGEWT